jgi:hypothetical protein
MDDSAGRPPLPWIHLPHPDPAGLLAVWSPERLALILTLALALLTAGVVVLCLQAFDKGVRDGRMPSRVRGQFYGRVIGRGCVRGLNTHFQTRMMPSQVSSCRCAIISTRP